MVSKTISGEKVKERKNEKTRKNKRIRKKWDQLYKPHFASTDDDDDPALKFVDSFLRKIEVI